MKLVIRKILAFFLVLMVTMLPLRAMAVPINMSADHCMVAGMTTEMSDVSVADYQTIAIEDEQMQNCNCCKQCVGHCTASASMTAVTFDLLKLSDITTHSSYAVTAESLFTHITSPPSRPPLSFYI